MYSRTAKCDELWPLHHRATFHSMRKVKKIRCIGTACQNHKNQWVGICASLLARRRLAREQHRPVLFCIVTGEDKWCLYANIRKRKEWLSPNIKELPVKRPARIHKDNVMHLAEQRGYAVPRIASARCNHHCWHLLPTTEKSFWRYPRKTMNNTASSDATPR